MYGNDWLSRQIEIIAKTLSVMLFGKDTANSIVTEDAEDKDGLTIKDEKLLELTLKNTYITVRLARAKIYCLKA